jgi:U3 small nucleolar RNA-associated protein 18
MEKQLIGKRAEEPSKWADPDDLGVQVDLSREARLRKVMRRTEQTVVDGQQYQELMRQQYQAKYEGLKFLSWTTEAPQPEAAQETHLQGLVRSERLLEAEEEAFDDILEIRKVAENAFSEKLGCVVQTIDTHQEHNNLFLAAGFDKTLKIFDIMYDKKNECTEMKCSKAITFPNLPIKSAKFYQRDQVIVSGLKKHILFHNFETDKTITIPNALFHKKLDDKQNVIDKFVLNRSQSFMAFNTENNVGNIGIMNPVSKQLLFELNMNESCLDMCFGRENHELLTVGDKGNVYVWDLRKRGIVERFKDHGATKTTSVQCVSNHLFTGSKAGILNMFNFLGPMGERPEPIKSFDHLSTSISTVAGSPDGMRLLVASKWKKNALKMINLNNKNVYKNWPNFKTNIGIVTEARFSTKGNYVVLGNHAGRLMVYEIS